MIVQQTLFEIFLIQYSFMDKSQTNKAKLIKLQNLLASETIAEITVTYIKDLLAYFASADLSEDHASKNQVYEELRDTVKAIFGYLQRVKAPSTQLAHSIENLIKDLLIAISNFCSAFYCQYRPLGCGDMIRDFLSSECRLFVVEIACAAPSQERVGYKYEDYIWSWARECSYKTVFFSKCIETIMGNLAHFESKFEQTKLAVIGQYLRLLYYMDDYLIKDKIENLCMSHVLSLENLFKSPSKEIMKEATKESLQEIIDFSIKLLRSVKNEQLKRKVNLLGVSLGMSMIKMPSIEKKIVGSKIINKFSYEMLYKNNFHLTEQYYSEWLIEKGFFEAVFEDHCQTSIVKLSDDTFKILMKRGCISKPKFQKFFQILEKADNELRKALFRLIDPFRVDYYHIQTINQIFKVIRNLDFYDDEFFYFYESISRYATQGQLITMISTVEEILNVYYSKFSTYLTRRRAVECYAYIFEKLIIYKDMSDRISSYKKVAEHFLESPSQSKLIMMKTLFNNLSESKLNTYYQEKLATEVVDEMQFLSRSLVHANNIHFREDLVYFIRAILNKYKENSYRKGFSKETLLKAVECPDIFEEMLKISKSTEIKGLLQSLSDLTKVKDFSFSCIRWAFIHLNQKCLKPIKKGYADVVYAYATIENIESFAGIDILTYLIFNSPKENVRKGSAELLAEIATNFTTEFRQEGEKHLVQFMKKMFQIISHKISEYHQGREDIIAVKGALQLFEFLLLSTEYFGVGSLKAHNSQIPTSSVWLKIFNNCLQNDDTQKIFQKKFPSNKTLFEVILEVSNVFKMGPLDIGLEFPNFDIIKYHGLTLQQLKLNGNELNAVKLPQSRCKIEPLMRNNQLSEKAKVVFTEIFNRYAVNKYLGHKECADYIGGVTLAFCSIHDSRISDLFYRYDLDKDERISIEDFLRFYKDCVQDPYKLENVEKNLYNLHYRSDLQPYNAEIQYNEQVLFRYHVWQNKQIYEHLFKLSNNDDFSLSLLAQNIILRLPTYDKIISSLGNTFDLKGKNSFEIQYMLTALQTHLSTHQGMAKELIEKGNHISIFEYLSILAHKQVRGQNDRNCLIICLHVLRTLLGSFSLREINIKKPQLAFELPKTNVFINIIRDSIKNNDSTLLQPAFALQLTQDELPSSLLEESAFSKDKDTRVLTCNFLYLWILSQKGKELNLFKIDISPVNNEEWFGLLTFITHFDIVIDYHQIFSDKIKVIKSNSESLDGVRINPIILGSLKLIKQIYSKLTKQQKEQLNEALSNLLPNLLSNQNRSLVYELKGEHPQALLLDLQRIVDIKMSKEVQARNRFVGIRNLGCICYMNSILQQFYMIKKFYSLVMSLQPNKEESVINNITFVDDFLAQLQQMYINLEWSQRQYYDPTTFCLAIKDPQGKPINTNIQEDAHEFLNSAFDKIQGYAKKEERIGELQRLFGGKTVTEIICQTCKNKNEVLQNYYYLSVQVKGMKSLKESFDKLIQVEQISDYFCSDCDKRVEKITKQIFIKESPEILIVNLQRIIFDLQTFMKVKVHTKLQFDQTLDLHSYFSSSTQPALYKLKGVVIHAGTSEGGHYYSLIKHEEKWYKFNDQSVTLFNEADIGRQAFGGDEVTDHWGEHSSSTNAYILFYEKAKESEEEPVISKSTVSEDLIQKVVQQNNQFAKQLQFYQPSFFTSLSQLVNKYTRPFLPQNKSFAQRLCQIHFKIVEHLSINSDIKTQIICQMRDNLLHLLTIIPQKSLKFIEEFNPVSFKEIICNNNDVNIRDIYVKVLAKSLLYSFQLQGQTYQQGEQIFSILIQWLQDELFLKNLHKSYQYFDLLKELIVGNEKMRDKIISKDYLALFLDLLLGKQSILFPKDKKRMDFHSSEAIPVISIIQILIKQKNVEKKGLSLENMSENQKKILNEGNFYRLMMKNKLDIQLLAPIIGFMACSNEKFSKMIAEVLLKGMNSNDEIQDKTIVFANIRAFLMIEDELKEERIKWVLGIPQLESISFSKPQFGLMTSSQSLVYTYVSSLFYIKDEKYQPFLFTLFQKRKFFNSFSAFGTIALLELSIELTHVRNYILTLPAPTYIQRCYFDWINNFIFRVKHEQHYGLPMDKKQLAEKLTTLMQQLKNKMVDSPLYLSLPVNKWIIGKNAQLTYQQEYVSSDIRINLIVHSTYVLQNKPFGNGNQSLPDDQFSFANTKEPVTARYFLKGAEQTFEHVEVEKGLTVLTFEIKNELAVAIKFKIPGFTHTVHFKAGSHTINTPYHHEALTNLIDIQFAHKEFVEVKQQENKEMNVEFSIPPVSTGVSASATPIFTDFYMQIECKACTYLNCGRQRCQVCDSDLLA